MSSHDFCRMLLSVTRKELTTEQSKRLVGGWSYTYSNGYGGTDSGEFQVPKDDYYWHGSCCCAYSARTNGINAWLQAFYPETDKEETS